MNYFLNIHDYILFYASILLSTIVLFILLFILVSIIKHFHLSKYFLYVIAIIFTLILIFFNPGNKILNRYNQGFVRELFITSQDENNPLLSVWLTRTVTYKAKNYYQHLQNFSLKSGKKLESLELIDSDLSNNYQFYWTKGEKEAWGYRPNSDVEGEYIQHIDLIKPEVIDNPNLLPNPNPPLLSSWSSRENTKKEGWLITSASNDAGKIITSSNNKSHGDSTTLYKPEFIEELNTDLNSKDKIWITHRSSILDDYDQLISYLSADGTEINKINLNKYFETKKIKKNNSYKIINAEMIEVITSYTFKDNIYIFTVRGKNYPSERQDFTLTALRTDKETGEILEQIDYIK